MLTEICDVEFTARQSECIYYICNGLKNKEIAEAMSLNVRTVDFHISSIKRITGCKTKKELIGLIFKCGMYDQIKIIVDKNKWVK